MWEEVTDSNGRIYFWNVDTDEVRWERPLKRKDKTHVKASLKIVKDSVKLDLIKSQPKSKILSRVWKDLSSTQLEKKELETIFKTKILSQQLVYSVYNFIGKWFRVWEKNYTFIKHDNFFYKSLLFYRWVEFYKCKDSYSYIVRRVSRENKELLKSIANLKVLVAQQNFSIISKI